MPKFKVDWLKVVTHLGALIPLALLVWDFIDGRLGPDPVRKIQFRTGKDAMVLLLLAFAVTPIRAISGFNQVARLRRILGVYAFVYVCAHLLNFVWLDLGLDPGLIYEEIFKKPYALVGFTVFLILIQLTATSTKAWQRRLGARWKQLHWLIYIAVPLDIIHFYWSRLSKLDTGEPLIYLIIAALLLIFRIPPVKNLLSAWRD